MMCSVLSFFDKDRRNVWVVGDVKLRGLQAMIQTRRLDFFGEDISNHLSCGHPSNTHATGVLQVTWNLYIKRGSFVVGWT